MNQGKIDDLLQVMARLRDPEHGCPWDLEQDFKTILPHTLEEAYEVADSIEQADMINLKEELGDLLFQIVFYAQMAREKGLFDFGDITASITEKMIDRHPHVFADRKDIRSSDDQTRAWEDHKDAKRLAIATASGQRPSLLDGLTKGLPSLLRAEKLQKRAAKSGFDWPNREPVIDKVKEELDEYLNAATLEQREEEIGDLLFVMANLARHDGINPEEALRKANRKFERRYRRMEAILDLDPKAKRDLAELDLTWDKVKAEEKAARTGQPSNRT